MRRRFSKGKKLHRIKRRLKKKLRRVSRSIKRKRLAFGRRRIGIRM